VHEVIFQGTASAVIIPKWRLKKCCAAQWTFYIMCEWILQESCSNSRSFTYAEDI